MASPSSSTAETRRTVIDHAGSVVVKVGTRVITTEQGQLDRQRIDVLAAQLCRIADTGRQVLMVSSGAVGAGMGKLGLAERPSGLAQLQAIAAVGQTDLIQAYESSLARMGHHAAQVLLTAADLRRRSGYLNVRNALTQIHAFGAIAIINENDSVAVSELMTTFGDNDRLASQVAGLLSDAMLIIFSDVDGLYDGPPSDPESQRLDLVETIDERVMAMAQVHRSTRSKGGMASKLAAAKVAASHGQPTIIAPGRDDRVLDKIFAGEVVGTLFLPPNRTRFADAVAGSVPPPGYPEAWCSTRERPTRLRKSGSSLLAIGIRSVSGSFHRGSVVAMYRPAGPGNRPRSLQLSLDRSGKDHRPIKRQDQRNPRSSSLRMCRPS